MNFDYKKQGTDFLDSTGTTFEAKYLGTRLFFPYDRTPRDVYTITLGRNGKKWSFRFGNSLAETEKGNKVGPSAYSVLAGLMKYDPGSFGEFCSDYGHSPDLIESQRAYAACRREYANVVGMFGDVMEQLCEIQ